MYSTSLFTPKTVFGNEPYVIFLNEMEEFKSSFVLPEERRVYMMKVVKMYHNQNKVFFPRNVGEFLNAVQTWKKDTNR